MVKVKFVKCSEGEKGTSYIEGLELHGYMCLNMKTKLFCSPFLHPKTSQSKVMSVLKELPHVIVTNVTVSFPGGLGQLSRYYVVNSTVPDSITRQIFS
jgi:hypothetical protein